MAGCGRLCGVTVGSWKPLLLSCGSGILLGDQTASSFTALCERVQHGGQKQASTVVPRRGGFTTADPVGGVRNEFLCAQCASRCRGRSQKRSILRGSALTSCTGPLNTTQLISHGAAICSMGLVSGLAMRARPQNLRTVLV